MRPGVVALFQYEVQACFCEYRIDKKKQFIDDYLGNSEQTIIIKSYLKSRYKIGLMRSWLSYVDFITRPEQI